MGISAEKLKPIYKFLDYLKEGRDNALKDEKKRATLRTSDEIQRADFLWYDHDRKYFDVSIRNTLQYLVDNEMLTARGANKVIHYLNDNYGGISMLSGENCDSEKLTYVIDFIENILKKTPVTEKALKESSFSDDDPDYTYLFKVTSRGGKYWFKIYQSPFDVKNNSYSYQSDNSMGGVKDKDEIISILVSTYLDIDYSKVIYDKLGIFSDYQYIVNTLDKKFKPLLKSSDKKLVYFYYDIFRIVSRYIKDNGYKEKDIDSLIDRLQSNINDYNSGNDK